ncbi:MAG: universal stress protein, partial [Methyloligellaceae bacterium]
VSLRKSFEKGHRRKFMVIIDNTPECEVALAFAGRVAQRTNGTIVLFLVIEPAAFQHWLGVQELKTDNQHQRAQEILQEFREKLSVMGFKGLRTETVIREGAKAEEITKYIERDEDVAILVLAASADKRDRDPSFLLWQQGAGPAHSRYPSISCRVHCHWKKLKLWLDSSGTLRFLAGQSSWKICMAHLYVV